MKTLLTIVVTVYNLESYIEKCLGSLADQLTPDVQVLVIDDGSTDGSKAKIKSFCKNPQIKYVYQENAGVSAARNAGISLADSEYITFIDGDDTAAPNYIETIRSELSEPTELLCFGYRAVDEKHNMKYSYAPNREPMRLRPHQGIIDFLHYRLQKECTPEVWNKIFRTDVLQDQDVMFLPEREIGEDGLFVVSYLECIRTVRFCPDLLMNYLLRSGSAMRRYHPHFAADTIHYVQDLEYISGRNHYVIPPADMMHFLLGLWFGLINNESKAPHYREGWMHVQKFLKQPYFLAHEKEIQHDELPFKLKCYEFLIRLHLSKAVYTVFFIRNRFRRGH